MKKESVVVFKGEDQFIIPRNKVYNMKSGKAEYVGQNGVKDGNVTPPTATDPNPNPPTNTNPPTTIIEDPDKGVNPPNQYDYSKGKFQMPDPTNPEFCQIVQTYITSRGHGSATPDDIMTAYLAFKKYCNTEPTPPYGGDQPPKKDDPIEPPKEDPKETPKDETPKETPKEETKNPVDPLKPKPEGLLPIIPTSLVTPNLGSPIGGGGGGGGEEEPKPTEKKKNYWWLLVVALGVGAYVYYKRRQ